MAKKVWISFPLITTVDLKDETVVNFLKGGSKKDLEVEAATFITKWLMDRSIPFGIDFDSCGVDRAVVIEALPKRLQKILAVPVVAETGEVTATDTTEVVVADVAEPYGEAEAAEVVDEVAVDVEPDGPSEAR